MFLELLLCLPIVVLQLTELVELTTTQLQPILTALIAGRVEWEGFCEQ